MTEPRQVPTRHTRRMPEHSVLYDRIIPGIFALLALVMLLLILVAAGVVLGFVQYR